MAQMKNAPAARSCEGAHCLHARDNDAFAIPTNNPQGLSGNIPILMRHLGAAALAAMGALQ